MSAQPHIASALRSLSEAVQSANADEWAAMCGLFGKLGASELSILARPARVASVRSGSTPNNSSTERSRAYRERKRATMQRCNTVAPVAPVASKPTATVQHDATPCNTVASVAGSVKGLKTSDSGALLQHVASVASAASRTLSLSLEEENFKRDQRSERGECNGATLCNAVAPVAPVAPRKRTATHVPTDPSENAEFARRWGLTGDATEIAKFLDHWRSKGEAKADWSAAWRNWQRNSEEYARPKPKPKPAWQVTKDARSVVQRTPASDVDWGVDC